MSESRGSLLLVEDEPGLVRTLGDRLRAAGYAVVVATDGQEGLDLGLTGAVEIIVLDVMLPRLDGFEVLRRLREAGSRIPVVMLTARGAVDDKVTAFRSGADDYLAKPFQPVELLARLDAVLRRVRGGALAPDERMVSFGPWVLDFEREELRRNHTAIPLSQTEYHLLAHLVRHRGRAVSREELLREVWRYAPTTATRTVDQHVAQLRRKLAEGSGTRQIATINRRGYQFRI